MREGKSERGNERNEEWRIDAHLTCSDSFSIICVTLHVVIITIAIIISAAIELFPIDRPFCNIELKSIQRTGEWAFKNTNSLLAGWYLRWCSVTICRNIPSPRTMDKIWWHVWRERIHGYRIPEEFTELEAALLLPAKEATSRKHSTFRHFQHVLGFEIWVPHKMNFMW